MTLEEWGRNRSGPETTTRPHPFVTGKERPPLGVPKKELVGSNFRITQKIYKLRNAFCCKVGTPDYWQKVQVVRILVVLR